MACFDEVQLKFTTPEPKSVILKTQEAAAAVLLYLFGNEGSL